MIFLAFCKVTETPYMNDSKRYSKTHVVIADDYTEARKKIEAHYRAKDDAYGVSYMVDIVDLEEAIT